MHLVTYLGADGARPGVLDGADVVEISGVDSVLDLLRSGSAGTDRAHEAVRRSRATGRNRVAVAEVALAAPLPRPNSIRDFMLVEEHVLNCFGSVPDEWYRLPAHWKGNPDTVIGPDDEVPWPYYTDKLDFELEVAVVLGREAHRVGPDEARDCIAGYTIFNDWSARDIQLREMSVQLGPAFGKDFATSMGPALVTPDEFDVADARMSARVNGETWSEGSLGSMVFGFVDVIVALSAEQRLQPGDVLGGGTIARGCGFELDRWIRPGDVVELEVSGLGVLRNVVGKKNGPPDSGPDLSAHHDEDRP
jgi:2-keto-4-pentenoate hydratase/2-oxohepta-3-ene-1,7-dioic acid hydratase in catechol pathway